MKKFISILLCLVMLFSYAVTGFAADENTYTPDNDEDTPIDVLPE